MKGSLTGVRTLVTGGTGALGSAVCEAMRAEGATVMATHHRGGEPGTVSGVRYVPCDVTDESSVIGLFGDLRSEGGPPVIVVHTAGGFAGGSVTSTDIDTWERMMTLNLRGTFLVLREAMRGLTGATYGRIVVVSALSALEPGKGAPAYRVSKAGVRLLADIAAAEVAGTGVTVNTVAPRIIDTPQNRKEMPEADVRRWVRPEAIATAIVHLCRPESGSLNGTVLTYP